MTSVAEDIQTLTSSEDPIARKRAAERLGQSKDPQAVAPLIAALDDRSEWVRLAAVGSLATLKTSQAVVPLIERLNDAVWRVRWATAQALGQIGDPRALPALEERTDPAREPDSLVRQAAREAIAQIQDTN